MTGKLRLNSCQNCIEFYAARRSQAAKFGIDILDRFLGIGAVAAGDQGIRLDQSVSNLGLDCGAMSGFDNAVVDRNFFPDGRFKTNFLCNIGYGDESKIFARSPRMNFEDACSFA